MNRAEHKVGAVSLSLWASYFETKIFRAGKALLEMYSLFTFRTMHNFPFWNMQDVERVSGFISFISEYVNEYARRGARLNPVGQLWNAVLLGCNVPRPAFEKK